MTDAINLHDDLAARMRPSPSTLAAVADHLATAGVDADTVCTPIWFPGKEYGIWCDDTRVEDAASIHADREEAATAAAKMMGEQPGTVGWVWHRVGGTWSVFEDILDAPTLLRLAGRIR